MFDGVCLTCYKGYDLNNGQCNLSTVNISKPIDLGCRTWDWDNQRCLECSTNWVFNAYRVCITVSNQCK